MTTTIKYRVKTIKKVKATTNGAGHTVGGKELQNQRTTMDWMEMRCHLGMLKCPHMHQVMDKAKQDGYVTVYFESGGHSYQVSIRRTKSK